MREKFSSSARILGRIQTRPVCRGRRFFSHRVLQGTLQFPSGGSLSVSQFPSFPCQAVGACAHHTWDHAALRSSPAAAPAPPCASRRVECAVRKSQPGNAKTVCADTASTQRNNMGRLPQSTSFCARPYVLPEEPYRQVSGRGRRILIICNQNRDGTYCTSCTDMIQAGADSHVTPNT